MSFGWNLNCDNGGKAGSGPGAWGYFDYPPFL